MNQDKIRNFCIIAHIDHGKSTLADRLIEMTGVLTKREMQEQVLDNMDLERERGITIKLQSVRTVYKAKDGNEYVLNLIDTPGHVDFTYEVSRSLAACEGAILVVDASQGVEAQTLANVYLALDNDLEIIPVINKIDLPSANPEMVIEEIENVIGVEAHDAPRISAKTGLNVDQVLEAIVNKVPAPSGNENAPTKALIFDSYYDNYKGAVAFIRVKDGKVKVGDTITLKDNMADKPLPGYKKVMPMVYCGIYPADGSDYEDLKDALEKLSLNDASLFWEPETSVALGFGFRCGFLGLLHMEIIQERIDREYDLNVITTAPSVIYKVNKTDGTKFDLYNPTDLPPMQEISSMEEPIVKADIMLPKEYVGNIMELCQDRRGVYKDMKYMDASRVILTYEMPLNEIIYDFFDALKSRSKGYASFDYEIIGYKPSELVKLDIMLNGDVIDAFSIIVHKDKAYTRGRKMAEKLKTTIPRQMFEIPIQAAIGGKVIARETISAMRKDVLAKCYGGYITRKKKLLEKQKEGKKKMRQLGTVDVPQEAFLSILKLDEE